MAELRKADAIRQYVETMGPELGHLPGQVLADQLNRELGAGLSPNAAKMLLERLELEKHEGQR